MRIAALVKSPEHVCCRYRVAAFQRYFEEAGHRLEFHPWPTTFLSRLLPRRVLGLPDVLIVQRKLMPAWQLGMLRRITGTLIFDFDDAVFVRDSFSQRGAHSTSRARHFANMVRKADIVVAGNSFLREQAAQWTNRDKIQLIPTCVDPTHYELASHHTASVRLVWIGSSSTLRALERKRDLLETIGQGCPNISLKLVCDRFLDLQHLPVERCPWNGATEARELADAEIGISWLPDDVWSRGKCGLKVLQYMAAGLPVVANPVGVQTELIRQGENGFIVETEAEWVQAINLLREDADLRRRMGLAGRQRVERDFSLNAGARLWLDNLCSRRLQPAGVTAA